jgi:glutamate synthase domain-containing protein 3
MEVSEGSWTSSVINEQLRKRLENNKSARVTNLASQPCIAVNMPPKTNISFDGNAGDNLAGLNNGSNIVLNGDAGRFVGNGMNKGEIIINGNCEEGTGHCLSGGTIVIQGLVEGSAGSSMKGGDLIISGSVRGDIATCMDGGAIIVCGDVTGYVGRMMNGGKVFLAGDFEDNKQLEIKTSSPSDLKVIKKTLQEHGIDPNGLNFKTVSSKLKSPRTSKKKVYNSISETLMLAPAVLSRRPRTPALDDLELSISIGNNKEEPLNLTIPLLWKGANAPVYAEWALNGKSPGNLNSANMAIIDLTATLINRRLDMKRPTDLTFVVELIRQATAKRIPIMVRLPAGDINDDLSIVSKSGADGVILVGDEIPIEAAITAARGFKNEMTILTACQELNCRDTAKMIALGSSGIFLEKECQNKELNNFAIELAETVGSLGIGKISDLGPENLRTSNQETAAMTGVPLAGYDSVLPMWRH